MVIMKNVFKSSLKKRQNKEENVMYYVIKHHFRVMINLKLSKHVRYTRTALDIIQYTQNEENRKMEKGCK